MDKVICADLFCGAGGSSSGLIAAAHERGLTVELVAINHWEVAIATHNANYPWARHICARIEEVRPRKVFPGGRIHLLVASPECTHHSVARGGRPIDDQKRVPAWGIVHWAQELYVQALLIENVREFQSWGPIGVNGKPLKSRKGETYLAFLGALRSLGYTVEDRVLCCADYGDATTRERLFILATRKGKPCWPIPTHLPEISRQRSLFSVGTPQRWRPAKEIIDWNYPIESIFTRRKPLAAKTMRRIVAGMRKLNAIDIEPFLVMFYGTNRTRSLDAPLPTVTAQGRHIGLAQPFVLSQASGGAARSVQDPVPTICAPGGASLVEPFVIATDQQGSNGDCVGSAEEPLTTVTTKARHAVVEPFVIGAGGPERAGDARSADRPLNTVLTRQSMAVVEPFLVSAGGPEGKGRQPKRVTKPMDTILTENHTGLVRPFVVVVNHGDTGSASAAGRKSIEVPLPTATGANTFGVVEPRCHSIESPLPTVTCKNGYGVVDPYIAKYYGTGVCQKIEEPLDTVTTKERFGLVEPAIVGEGDAGPNVRKAVPLVPLGNGRFLDIRFRMLQPHELAAAQGFPKGYKFTGKKSTQVKQIGNAVPHYTAKALCGVLLDRYRAKENGPQPERI